MEILLDLKDKKILSELDLNSRQPNSKIAKKVRLSKDIINYRIKELEKKGVIQGYYPIIDFSRLGYFSVRVYLRFFDTGTDKEKEMIAFLVKHRKVLFVAKTHGYSDLTFGVLVKDIYEFEAFYEDFKKLFKENILNDKISIYTRVSHFHRSYILGKNFDEAKPEMLGGGPLTPHDELDLKILRSLSGNARIPLIDLSKSLSAPSRTIAHRIKRMEKNKIIQGYRFIFGFNLLSLEYYKIDFILKNTSRLAEIRNYCRNYPGIVSLSQSIGGADVEIFLEIKGKNQFHEIINVFREKFPEIRSWEHFEFEKYHKLKYFLE